MTRIVWKLTSTRLTSRLRSKKHSRRFLSCGEPRLSAPSNNDAIDRARIPVDVAPREFRDRPAGDCDPADASGGDAVVFFNEHSEKSSGGGAAISRFRRVDTTAIGKRHAQLPAGQYS